MIDVVYLEHLLFSQFQSHGEEPFSVNVVLFFDRIVFYEVSLFLMKP